MYITFSRVLALDVLIAGNPIQQISRPDSQAEGTLTDFSYGRGGNGFLFQSSGDGDEILIIPKARPLPETRERIIHAVIDARATTADLSGGVWVRHPSLHVLKERRDQEAETRSVLASWAGSFSYVQEDRERNVVGLRGPQLGALHMIRGHWFASNAPATIVMPTGTGKTETMLSVLVSVPCSKVLVVVPSDTLRAQLAEKFATLGILKAPRCDVLRTSAKYPIVCLLRHIPSVDQVDEICSRSNVIVTTSSIAAQCTDDAKNHLAQHCPYLFIDEAHHAETPTWKDFKQSFGHRRILQFTATPFREDGKPLDGDIIFKYPLKRAQEEEYFRPIRFEPVVEFNRRRADIAIREKAIERLRADAHKGHIVMARVESVARAAEVFKLYEPFKEFNPVQLHTGIKSNQQRAVIRRQIIGGQSRIVVCVDMLGEGFDLPELKIAAFHDIRKTLAVTLQLAGRFTRARPDLGEATFVANTADMNVRDELRKLYSRDPDWNVLLPQLSDQLIGEQVSLQEFLRGFTELTKEIPLRTVKPATSTVVYRTTCRAWNPENYRDGIPGLDSCAQVHDSVNHTKHTLVIITARQVPLDWTDVASLFSWEWELYVVMWSPEQKLLFINSSTNSGEYKALAEAVTDENSTLIKGQDVFRTFAGVNRLRLQNVGLTEQLGRNVRYVGRMGADAAAGITDLQRRHAKKSVFSGNGYENGERTTVGASRRGRIWSHQRGNVEELVTWCRKIGAKLLDTSIDPDEVLRGTLEPRVILERPDKMPIAVAWPEELYRDFEASWAILIDQHPYALDELGLEMAGPALGGPLRIAISSEADEARIELEFFQDAENPNYRFVVLGNRSVQVRRSERAQPESATAFFYNNPPVIWFVDGSSLEGNEHVELKYKPPYDVGKIQTLDWSDTDIRKEAQGSNKDATSVQAKVIRELRGRAYDMVIDDHSKGEAADVVTIRRLGRDKTDPMQIEVEFYHCKSSKGAQKGSRLDDLYEVCGQAQKSTCWMFSPEKGTDLFTHLLRREATRRDANAPSRYEVGDRDLLLTIREMSRTRPVSLKINIVQPGLSKAQASREQLELLSVTENHLKLTFWR